MGGGENACPHVTTQSLYKIPNASHLEPFVCTECKSEDSPWLCLNCGGVHCGRYVNGHAIAHFEEKKHCISVNCYSLNVYCYICDKDIINHLIPSNIFDRLNAIHEALEGSCTDGEDNSSSSSRSTTEEGPSPSITNGKGRRRRKGRGGLKRASHPTKLAKSEGPARNGRKRDYYSESSSSSENSNSSINGDLCTSSHEPDNQLLGESKKRKLSDETELGGSRALSCGGPIPLKSDKLIGTGGSLRRAKENVSLGGLGKNLGGGGGKHGVVGLRNLGNTCFMNAVLQSLSKIRGFSCYISHIPPPDQLRLNNSIPFNDSSSPRFVYSTRSRKNGLLSTHNSINSPERPGSFVESGPIRSSTPVNHIVSSSDANEIRRTEELLTSELRKILILLNTKGSSAVSPDSLFSIIWEVMPRFRGYQQQDAHEFLRYMLDQLHNELVRLVPTFSWNDGLNKKNVGLKGAQPEKPVKMIGHKNGKNNGLRADALMAAFGYKGTPSIVTSMFGGVLENEVRCSRCGTESKKHDPFLDLSLDIPMGNGGEARLEDCLSSFTDIEELSDNDKYFCSYCQAHQKSTKRFSIRRLPNVLCLHLKRFRWSNYLRTKLDHFVQFPMTSLDMSEYLLDSSHTTRGSVSSNLYDLAAVIVHHGTGVGTGHYTAFAKKDSQWYHFNDSAVKPSEESAVAKCKAYILFYTRSEFKL